MKTAIAYKAKGQRGFTLVELVVVIAILGVLSAIAVPFISSHLGESKDRAYEVDRERFQQAVDAFYSRPSNIHYLGRPQYPIIGMNRTTRTFVKDDHKHDKENHLKHKANHQLATGTPDHIAVLTPLGNPLGGTQGGSPRWIDGPFPDGDGIRDRASGEEELLDNDANSLDKPGWHVATVNRQGTLYIVDTRDYFIDFTKLAALGLLEDVPLSSSLDNKPKDPPPSIQLMEASLTPGGLTMTPPTSPAGVTLWVVGEGAGEDNRRVFQYSLQGDKLGSFLLTGDPPNGLNNDKAKGITTDGNSFWVLDKGDKGVYRYDLVGNFSSFFALDNALENKGLEGITTDGTSLWVLDKFEGVSRYNTNGDFQVSISIENFPSHPEGITTDGERFWMVDEDGLVYQFTLEGAQIGFPFSVLPSSSHPEGIATDGNNLWVVDKATKKIYPFGLDGGEPEPVTGVYTGSYSWYVDPDGKVKSLFFFLPEPDSTGFQTAYP